MSLPEGARRSDAFFAICTEPNLAWTPRGGEKVLVPYMIACHLGESQECSPNTFFTSQPVFLWRKSHAPRVEGNEPGVGDGGGTSGVDGRGNGGVRSKIHNGVVRGEENAVNVFVNGLEVVRHGDKCWMNEKP